jgi:hypothetical protein
LHADFLSIPPVRYAGKAGEAPEARCPAPQERFQLEQRIVVINASTTQQSGIR